MVWAMANVFRFKESVLHLQGAGPIGVTSNEPGFWALSNRPEFDTGQMVSVFDYCRTWDYAERHPDGEELAVVLDGDIDFLIDEGGGELAVRLERGHGCIVPTGAWHRVA